MCQIFVCGLARRNPLLSISCCQLVLKGAKVSLGAVSRVNRRHVLQNHMLVGRFVVALITQQELVRQTCLVTDVEGFAVALLVPFALLLLDKRVKDGELQMRVVHFLNCQRLRFLIFSFFSVAKCVWPGVFDWSVCFVVTFGLVVRHVLGERGYYRL